MREKTRRRNKAMSDRWMGRPMFYRERDTHTNTQKWEKLCTLCCELVCPSIEEEKTEKW
jgi:hypothetical protein